ncbi:unnamed protein product [Gordionus sp. m RMFG-2023]
MNFEGFNINGFQRYTRALTLYKGDNNRGNMRDIIIKSNKKILNDKLENPYNMKRINGMVEDEVKISNKGIKVMKDFVCSILKRVFNNNNFNIPDNETFDMEMLNDRIAYSQDNRRRKIIKYR